MVSFKDEERSSIICSPAKKERKNLAMAKASYLYHIDRIPEVGWCYDEICSAFVCFFDCFVLVPMDTVASHVVWDWF